MATPGGGNDGRLRLLLDDLRKRWVTVHEDAAELSVRRVYGAGGDDREDMSAELAIQIAAAARQTRAQGCVVHAVDWGERWSAVSASFVLPREVRNNGL